jgi:phenylalanyl-tRNA synthetase beta chain
MKVLVSWLRELVDAKAGAEDLGQRLHLAGFELAGIEPHGPDSIVDLEITANRPDCLSMVGIAREVATLYDTPLRWQASSFPAAGETAESGPLRVTIEDAELCPRYCAAIADVTVGASPAWLVARLAAAGIRSINNIVDITNYVLLETGHPLHAFDLAKLAGPHIRVRRAAPGETVKTLDGQTRTLAPDMLVIADAERAQAVAGVMGGAESEVSTETRTIALESAYFHPPSVRRTSKRLALSTEASYRFERGADPEAASSALARACELIAQIGAGTVRPGWIDARPAPRAVRTLVLRHSRVRRVLGFDVEANDIERFLRALGFGIGAGSDESVADEAELATLQEMKALFDTFGGDGSADPSVLPDVIGAAAGVEAHRAAEAQQPAPPTRWIPGESPERRRGRDRRRSSAETLWRATVPSWRIDVAREIDLIEEVARIHGYERIPTTFPALTAAPPAANVRLRRDAHVRAIARALGFAESVTFSFIERETAVRYAGEDALVSIANPLSENFAVMRPALLPGLVASVAHNRRREQRDVRLFELANRFTRSRGEHRALALAWTGAASLTHWSGTARAADIYDLTGAVTALGHAIGFDVTFAPAASAFVTEATASAIVARPLRGGEATTIGVLGQLEAGAADAAGLPAREAVLVAEIDLDAVLPLTDLGDRVRATPLPRFPSSVRDLSLLVPLGLPAADIRGTIRESAPATLESVFEFDRYQGRGVPEGACSVSVRLTFRSAERTLTDAEVQTAVDALVSALAARHNATLR